MNFTPLFATFLYLAATVGIGLNVFHPKQVPRYTLLASLGCSSVALWLHGLLLYQYLFVETGLDLGFFNTFSLLSWLVTLFVIISSLYRPLENLLIILLPFAALTLYLKIIFPEHRILNETLTLGMRIHILLSISAYSLLMISALQALLFAFQEKLIATKQVNRIINILPPLQVMEQLLIQFIIVGFFMLSLSLASGMMFIEDLFAQHLIHKTVLSILAWLIYGILLCGRWLAGWRGKRITRWALCGFIMLLMAYIGTKFVLELLLRRV